MRDLTPYERNALEEIEKWRKEDQGFLDRTLSLLGEPVGWIFETLVPGPAKEVLGKAILGGLELLKEIAYQTYSHRDILQEARKVGIVALDVRELAGQEMEKLDLMARSYFASNKLMAALEGAGCGLGGPALLAADIPALFILSLRAVQQIGTCYGFDMRGPAVFPVVLNVFSAASAGGVALKTGVLLDMRMAAMALTRGWTYKKIAEKTQTGVLVQILKERSKGLPKEIAQNLTKRKLGQTIPLAGALLARIIHDPCYEGSSWWS